MSIKQLSSIALLAASIHGLSGCALAHRPYVSPEGGARAYLRVLDSDGQSLPGTVFISTFEKSDNCQKRYFLQGIPSQMKPTAITLSYASVPANQPFNLAVNVPLGGSFSGGFRFCAPVVQFTPEANRYYTVTIAVDGQKACYLSLKSAESNTDTRPRAEPVKRMVFSNGIDEDSSFCKPE